MPADGCSWHSVGKRQPGAARLECPPRLRGRSMKRSASSALTLLALAACTGEPRAAGLPPAGSNGEGGSSIAPNEAPAAGAALQSAAGIGADTDADIPALSREGDGYAPTEPGSP